MKVWIVTKHRENYKPGKIIGVFHNKENAEKLIDSEQTTLYDEVNGDGNTTKVVLSKGFYYTIQEWKVS